MLEQMQISTFLLLHEGTWKQAFCDFREVFPAQFSKFILNIHINFDKGIIKSLIFHQPHNPSHISLYGSNHYTLAAPLFRIASNRADNRPLLQGSSQHSWQNCSQAMARMAFQVGSVFHVLQPKMRHNKHMCKAKGLKILQILTYTCTYNTILFSNCFTIVLGIASGFLQRNSKFGSVNLMR